MIKVLQVISGLNRGGAETLLVNIVSNIDTNKYKIDFLVYGNDTYEYEKELEQKGCEIYRLDMPTKIGMIKFIKKLTCFLKKNKYDVIHAHNLFNCGPVMLSAFFAKVKVRISHSHNTKYLEESITFKKKIYYFLSKMLINILSTKKLACGEDAGKFLFYNNKSFEIINNGIDVEKYKFSEQNRTNIRNKYNIDDDAILIGHVGRFNFQKNHDFLLDIVYELIKRNNKIYLFLIGNGELEKDIIRKIGELKIKTNVILIGSINNVNEYYSAFDIFLFPSLFEGLPYTLIEAQCNGLTIFASDTISSEVNISNEIHFLSLNLDSKEWCHNIQLELKKGIARKDNIEKVINSGYSIKNTVLKLERIYNGK